MLTYADLLPSFRTIKRKGQDHIAVPESCLSPSYIPRTRTEPAWRQVHNLARSVGVRYAFTEIIPDPPYRRVPVTAILIPKDAYDQKMNRPLPGRLSGRTDPPKYECVKVQLSYLDLVPPLPVIRHERKLYAVLSRKNPIIKYKDYPEMLSNAARRLVHVFIRGGTRTDCSAVGFRDPYNSEICFILPFDTYLDIMRADSGYTQTVFRRVYATTDRPLAQHPAEST